MAHALSRPCCRAPDRLAPELQESGEEEPNMRLQDIMSTDIKTVTPSVTVATARNLMRLDGIHHLLVLDDRRVVGVVSDRDLGGRVGARRGAGAETRIAEVMSEQVVTAPADATIRQAANLMRGNGIGCLAVVAYTLVR